MPLFKEKIIKEQKQDEKTLNERYENLLKFQAKAELIKSVKEEEYQTAFLQDIFENCLGYTLKTTNPQNFNLEREKKNKNNSKKCDGAILDKNGEVIGVIELKDQKTHSLDKIENQAFDYHNSQDKNSYIIISNFDEIRFYIEKKTAYEKFNLLSMTRSEFEFFHLIFSYESIIANLPKTLKEKSESSDNEISKKLYADFSEFRLKLFDNAVSNNQNLDKKQILSLVQKFCDRIIFVLFAEDCGLLRVNFVSEINSQWQNQKLTKFSLYEIWQIYFDAIDKGNEKLGVLAYNGGLFATDEALNSLKFSDEILQSYIAKLSSYDFASDISVNILGHIFEQSLSDLEELNSQIVGDKFDKKDSKRKKDGIFYTPEYITKFIVEQTLGQICEAKKEELKLYKLRYNPTQRRKDDINAIYAYRDFLLNLKIIDPACGSGAFLNAALEFLINEHKWLDEFRRIYEKEALSLYDIETSILENNLFGVDINADAVQIAKLSLWLRTAQKGRKLTDLSNNIKCGNSLIDDKSVDENAFVWEKEFPEIMANGGFDIVIGNPPYVNINTQPEIHNYLRINYPEIHTGYNDLMYYFLFKGIKLLKSKTLAYFGMIVSNYFIRNEYAKKLRLFLNNYIETIIDFREQHVFEDANVHTAMVFAKSRNISDNIEIYTKNNSADKKEINISDDFEKCIILRNEVKDTWIIATNISNEIIKKIKTNFVFLGNIAEIAKGAESGKNGIFSVPKSVILDNNIEKELVRLCIKNSSIQRYRIIKNDLFLIYTDNYFSKEKYPYAYKYLLQYKEILLDRRGPKNSEYEWWRLHRPSIKEIFDAQEKIVVPYRAEHNRFAYDDNQCFNDGGDIRSIVIKDTSKYSIKFIIAILNSKLFDWYYGFIGKTKGSMREYFNKPLSEIPIPNIDIKLQQPFINLADKLIELNSNLQSIKTEFLRELNLEKIPQKLAEFENLEFDEFIKEYAKAKKEKFADKLAEVKFKNYYQGFFSEYKSQTLSLKSQISQSENELNSLVYALYDLTADEIALIENA